MIATKAKGKNVGQKLLKKRELKKLSKRTTFFVKSCHKVIKLLKSWQKVGKKLAKSKQKVSKKFVKSLQKFVLNSTRCDPVAPGNYKKCI
jgi:L-lactate utilization protein LutB